MARDWSWSPAGCLRELMVIMMRRRATMMMMAAIITIITALLTRHPLCVKTVVSCIISIFMTTQWDKDERNPPLTLGIKGFKRPPQETKILPRGHGFRDGHAGQGRGQAAQHSRSWVLRPGSRPRAQTAQPWQRRHPARENRRSGGVAAASCPLRACSSLCRSPRWHEQGPALLSQLLMRKLPCMLWGSLLQALQWARPEASG